jgi:glycerophosphoryl diester phosphodiesterase
MRVIGHRGASMRAPENTIPAFLLALEEGADGVETDARMTADGAIVLMHSDDLSETTDGAGRVSEMSFAEIRALDAAARSDGWQERLSVPTLLEAIEILRGRADLVVEIKGWTDGGGYVPPLDTARAVAEMIAPVPRVTISSFDAAAIAAAAETQPGIRTALTCGRFFDPSWALTTAAAVGHAEFHVSVESVESSFIENARGLGIDVLVWTVNEASVARDLQAMGVVGVFTDDPAAMRAALG